MGEFLQISHDKYLFKIMTDRRYSRDGIWAMPGAMGVTMGLSDYQQQRAGDMAFAALPQAGVELGAGDELASLETIKVDLSLGSPVAGMVTAANGALEMEAELINLDPYGRGWLVMIQPDDWERDQAALLSPEQYAAHIEAELAAEAKT